MTCSTNPENVYYFRDRVPGVRAAGVLTRLPGDSVHQCLTHPEYQQVCFEEGDPCNGERTAAGCRRPQRTAYDHRTGIACVMKPCMGHPLLNELCETAYQSWWCAPLGRRRHLHPPPPGGKYPECLTHGICTVPSVIAGDLINPKHSIEEVCRDECAKGLYKVSHDAFEPGEQIRRPYCPPFDIYSRFGRPTPHFNDGTMVRRIMHWHHSAPVTLVTHHQANYTEKKRAHLGRCKGPVCITGRQASKQALFGLCDIGITDSFEQCATKREQLACMKHINTLRKNLKRRVPSFPFDDLNAYIRQLCGCGCVPLDVLERECKHFRVFINKPIIQLMKNLGIIYGDNLVDLGRFVNLINWQCRFPELPNAFNTTDPCVFKTVHKLSMTGQRDCEDPERAGKPINQYDIADPIPQSGLRADRESLEYETDAVAVLHPSIFTRYGLDHMDFFKPRCQSEIKKLFCEIGVDMPPDDFQKLWDEGCKLDCTGGVCIETFRNLLDKYAYERMCK